MLLRMIRQIEVSGDRFRCVFVVFLYVARSSRIPVAKFEAFMLNYEVCHASPRQMEPRKKISAPALMSSLNLELISSNK